MRDDVVPLCASVSSGVQGISRVLDQAWEQAPPLKARQKALRAVPNHGLNGRQGPRKVHGSGLLVTDLKLIIVIQTTRRINTQELFHYMVRPKRFNTPPHTQLFQHVRHRLAVTFKKPRSPRS